MLPQRCGLLSSSEFLPWAEGHICHAAHVAPSLRLNHRNKLHSAWHQTGTPGTGHFWGKKEQEDAASSGRGRGSWQGGSYESGRGEAGD